MEKPKTIVIQRELEHHPEILTPMPEEFGETEYVLKGAE